MKKFMDEDFLLGNETAKTLFNQYAKHTPILDYHCHVNPREIAEDKKFGNITQIWLGGDHYKWRYMRNCGVDEYYITGEASDYEKFMKWAKCLGKAIGNPLYHWSHLELQRYFNYYDVLNEKNAKDVWEHCNKMLSQDSMTVRNIIKQSGVTLICTTDDPIDTLEWHKIIREDSSFDVKVLPAWRPDKAMNIEKEEFGQYMRALSKASGIDVTSFATLKEALKNRMDYFEAMGCLVSDHGLEYIMYEPATDEEIDNILKKRLLGEQVTRQEELRFKTKFMLFCGKEYYRRNWAMQLHYGCRRNNNSVMYEILGPDTGYDCIDNYGPSAQIGEFLNGLSEDGHLPKTILYSLNPNDNVVIGTIVGCFQDSSVAGKIQHGSAWWFNDNKEGMREHMISLANQGSLCNFIGMLTDSRSFLSYTRHEYFRRILCNFIGELVENGEFPQDYETLGEIIKDISYNNGMNYFNFKL